MEIREIKGYEDRYGITKNGRVWSYPREIIKKDKYGNTRVFNWKGGWIKSHTTKKGDWYFSIKLGHDGKGHKIHRLVAEAFLPNPNNLREVNHINGIKADNRVENIEWIDRKGNMEHGAKILPFSERKIKRGSKNPHAKLNEKDVLYIKKQHSLGEISNRKLGRKFGVSTTTINSIINGVMWKHVLLTKP